MRLQEKEGKEMNEYKAGHRGGGVEEIAVFGIN